MNSGKGGELEAAVARARAREQLRQTQRKKRRKNSRLFLGSRAFFFFFSLRGLWRDFFFFFKRWLIFFRRTCSRDAALAEFDGIERVVFRSSQKKKKKKLTPFFPSLSQTPSL